MKSITFKATEAKGPVIVLIGRRDTGKSYLVRPPLPQRRSHRNGYIGHGSGKRILLAHIPASSSTTSIIAC
jgi:hypothetical protein